MTAQDFTVERQRVLVVGAARSGVAAALLLVRRGATVTLTDQRPSIADEDKLEGLPRALAMVCPVRQVARCLQIPRH